MMTQGNKIIALSEEALEMVMTRVSGGAGDGGSSDLGARVAKLEASVEHIQRDIADIKLDVRSIKTDAKTDFHKLFGAIIFVALGLAGLMAKGFHWF